MANNNKELLKKLKSLIKEANNIRCPTAGYYDKGYDNDEVQAVEMGRLLDKTRRTLRRFQLYTEEKEVDEIFTGESKEDFLEIVCEPPDRKAEFLVVRRLYALLNNLIYTYSDGESKILNKTSIDSSQQEEIVSNNGTSEQIKSYQSEEIIAYSDDFRWVKFPSREFSLTPPQAEIIQYFYERQKEGIPQLSQHRVLANLESKSKALKDSFKSRPGAKNMLFESPYKGMYRLRIKIPSNSR